MTSATTNRRLRPRGIRRIDLAYAQLASSEVARDINRDVVLELVRTRQPISRADLARVSGLQPSTVSSIVEQLLGEKWITESAATIRPRGRRPTLLSLNSGMVIVVADVRPTQATVAVVDLNGRFLSREVLPLGRDAERGVQSLISSMKRTIEQHPDKSFEGIGICLPGRVDPVTQCLILAPNLPWVSYDLKRVIEKAIPLKVEMDNAANACLLSELWYGRMDGVRNAVLVTISEGIGAAILTHGQLVIGQCGLAGEFGHIPLFPDGILCGCGRQGCLEMYASSRAAIGYYAYLGRGLRIMATVLAPEVILLTGGLTASWARFGRLVEAELADHMLAGPPPRIAITSDMEMARLRGAAALVLQRHTGYGGIHSTQETARKT